MKIKFYGIKDSKLTLLKTDTVKHGMKLQFHEGVMENWCKEIRFEGE